MFQPEQYAVTLALMIASMACWGSWANTMKLTPGWPFQAYYWDYVLGILSGSLLWGLTLGSFGSTGMPFLESIYRADVSHILLAIAGGIVFNIANLLLVAAIEVAGLAVAFPVGIGLALVTGVVLNYLLAPAGNVLLLTLGVTLVVLAILVDALAYRLRERVHSAVSARGIQLSTVAGILMGLFYPLVARALEGSHALNPYSVSLFFAIGVALCSIPLNLWLMRKPITATQPVSYAIYFRAPLRWHLWAVLGGGIWCTGAVFNFVSSRASLVGPATSYAIGQGATMVSALWGVFVWKEFRDAPRSSRRLLPWMFFLFITGLTAVALAPVFTGNMQTY